MVAAVGDIEQLPVRFHRFADPHVGADDEAGLGGLERDGRGRVSRLAALDPGENLTGFDLVSYEGIEFDHPSGDAGGENGVSGGDLLDPANGKDRGLKVPFLGRDRFDAQVLDAGFVQTDTEKILLRFVFFLGCGKGQHERGQGK